MKSEDEKMCEESEEFSDTNLNIEECRKNFKLRKILNVDKIILNRRKKKLDELLSQGDYFSEDAIKQRDPILYEIYVGSHKRKNPLFTSNKLSIINSEGSVTKFLMDELDHEIYNNNLSGELNKEVKDYGVKEMNSIYVSQTNFIRFINL
jgi:hypothetical protein